MNTEEVETRAFKLVTDWIVQQPRPMRVHVPDMEFMATVSQAANLQEDAAGYQYAQQHLGELVHKVTTTQNIRKLREEWETLLAESQDLLQSCSDWES